MKKIRKTLHIVRREYTTRVCRKSFLLGTFAGPFVIVSVILLPHIFAASSVDERRQLAVTDETGLFGPRLEKVLGDTLRTGQRKYVVLSIKSTHRQRRRLVTLVESGALDGYLDIPADILGGGHPLYYIRGVKSVSEIRRLEYAMTQIITRQRLLGRGFDAAAAAQITAPLSVTAVPLQDGGIGRGTTLGGYILTMVFAGFLYMTTLFYGISVMRAVIEEKACRVVEVMLASVTPFQLMMGKVIGVGAAGFTQCLIWAGFAFGLSVYGTAFTGGRAAMPAVPPDTLLAFLVFYLLGYFLFAVLYAGIGAVSNTDQDAQQYQLVLSLCLVVPVIIMPVVVQAPNTPAVQWLSFVPVFTPVLMFARMQAIPIPPFEVALAVLLLLGTILLSLMGVSRVFRIGVLMYGKRPTLSEIGRWMRYR